MMLRAPQAGLTAPAVAGRGLSEGLGVAGYKLDLAFDFYGDTEWQLSKPDRAASVHSSLLAEHFKDEFGKAIDDRRLPSEAWRGVDHAEGPRPIRDSL